MKKLILILMLASVFTLAACDSDREEITANGVTTTITTADTTTEQSGLENAGTAPMDDLDWGALVPIG